MVQNRILKAKQIKKALQCYKNGAKLAKQIGGFMNPYNLQVNDDTLRDIASLFNMTIKKVNTSSGYWRGSVLIEGVEVFAHNYNFEHDKDKTYKFNHTKKMYKEAFFETDGDKEQAFSIMKERDKNKYLEHYKTLSDLQKFWVRHENKKLNVENIYAQYQLYRKYWERYEENSVARYEYDSIRPMHDYWTPATMKEWYKHNFQK